MAVLFVATLALAGEDVTPKTKAGDQALLFSFSGLSELGANSYMGGLGGKYYFQDDMALRLGLGFGFSGSTTKGTDGAPDYTNNTMNFSINPALIYNLKTTGAVDVFVGGAVGFSWYGNTLENPPSSSYSKVVTTTTNFSVGGLVGFEWFPWENISLGAEYGLNLKFGSGSVEKTFVSDGHTETSDDPSTTAISLGSNGGITLGVWF